jgi:DNA mismatch endonuclease, patch repair protein
MRANRRVDTGPEKLLRAELHARGLRFRKDHPVPLRDCRPRPDVAFTALRIAVFVDGCFWHGCPTHRSRPKSNADFWEHKIRRNRERDREQNRALEAANWRVIRVWEHMPVVEAADLVEREVSRAKAVLSVPEERGSAKRLRRLVRGEFS